MLTITVDIPDNREALAVLESALRDGGIDDLREMFMWMAQIAESAIKVEVKRDGSTARRDTRL